jgi:hypothetical protein
VRARCNAEHTLPLTTTAYSGHLLPGHEDDSRWRAEAAAQAERQLGTTVLGLVRQSLLDGHEYAAMLEGAALGIQVRGTDLVEHAATAWMSEPRPLTEGRKARQGSGSPLAQRVLVVLVWHHQGCEGMSEAGGDGQAQQMATRLH